MPINQPTRRSGSNIGGSGVLMQYCLYSQEWPGGQVPNYRFDTNVSNYLTALISVPGSSYATTSQTVAGSSSGFTHTLTSFAKAGDIAVLEVMIDGDKTITTEPTWTRIGTVNSGNLLASYYTYTVQPGDPGVLGITVAFSAASKVNFFCSLLRGSSVSEPTAALCSTNTGSSGDVIWDGGMNAPSGTLLFFGGVENASSTTLFDTNTPVTSGIDSPETTDTWADLMREAKLPSAIDSIGSADMSKLDRPQLRG